jgi:hypothetical protein
MHKCREGWAFLDQQVWPKLTAFETCDGAITRGAGSSSLPAGPTSPLGTPSNPSRANVGSSSGDRDVHNPDILQQWADEAYATVSEEKSDGPGFFRGPLKETANTIAAFP